MMEKKWCGQEKWCARGRLTHNFFKSPWLNLNFNCGERIFTLSINLHKFHDFRSYPTIHDKLLVVLCKSIGWIDPFSMQRVDNSKSSTYWLFFALMLLFNVTPFPCFVYFCSDELWRIDWLLSRMLEVIFHVVCYP